MKNYTKYLFLYIAMGIIFACSNNPYPDEKDGGKTLYSSFSSPPKDLDPQVAYTSTSIGFLRLCYDPLVDYHYLDSSKLVPALAKSVPKPIISRNKEDKVTEVRYKFDLHQGVMFADDPCFPEGKGREMTAKDFEYVFKRVADAEVNCPIASQFNPIKGFKDYSKKLAEFRGGLKKQFLKENERKFDAGKDYFPSKNIYDKCGSMPGLELTGKYSFDLILSKEYPQIMYWFAMRFICATPYEAVDFYNPTKEMTGMVPMNFNMHPVGTGPYKFKWDEFRKQQKIVMTKNPNWWGNKIAAPTTRFPDKPFTKEDEEKGYWTKERAGTPLAACDRIEWYKETEPVTKFGKFTQGYYDDNLLPPEKLDEALSGQELSEDMKKQGIKMNKSAKINVRYIGFNMEDERVGSPKKFSDPKMEAQRDKLLIRNRKLRQAMNLAINLDEYIRVKLKGMGINTETLLPSAIPGYDPNFKHPYKYRNEQSLDKARQLLKEAGYENGIDPETGKPLQLSFTYGKRNPDDDLKMAFFIESWGKIGLDVEADANEYNQFQKKVYGKNFQTFTWGWYADYPDAENFLFLLISDMAGTANHAFYQNPEYDFYFEKLKPLANDASTTWLDKESGKTITMTRKQLITKCLEIFVEDCPWIMLNSDVDLQLYQNWLKNNKAHPLITYPYEYYDIDTEERTKKRKLWNVPITWPAYLIVAILLALIVPAFTTYFKERN